MAGRRQEGHRACIRAGAHWRFAHYCVSLVTLHHCHRFCLSPTTFKLCGALCCCTMQVSVPAVLESPVGLSKIKTKIKIAVPNPVDHSTPPVLAALLHRSLMGFRALGSLRTWQHRQQHNA